MIFLNGTVDNLFHRDTAIYQFAPGLGYQPQVRDAGGSIIVTDLHSAIKAVDTIVIQGEGSPGPYDDPDKLEEDHYDIFMGLKDGDATWDTYPVVENPVTSDYWNLDKRIYYVSCFPYPTSDNSRHLTKLFRFHSHSTHHIASS